MFKQAAESDANSRFNWSGWIDTYDSTKSCMFELAFGVDFAAYHCKRHKFSRKVGSKYTSY